MVDDFLIIKNYEFPGKLGNYGISSYGGRKTYGPENYLRASQKTGGKQLFSDMAVWKTARRGSLNKGGSIRKKAKQCAFFTCFAFCLNREPGRLLTQFGL